MNARTFRPALVHLGTITRLSFSVTPFWLHLSLVALVGTGAGLGCRELLADRTGAWAGGMALLLWMVPTQVRASWLGGSTGEQPLLPLGRRLQAFLEGTFISALMVPAAVLVTWGLAWFDATHPGGEPMAPTPSELGRGLVLVWPFVVASCLPRRPLGEDALASTLPPALVLAAAAWIPSPTVPGAGLVATWPGVILVSGLMTGLAHLELPQRLARRATLWVERSRRAVPRTLTRPGLPAPRRLSQDLWAGILRGSLAVGVGCGLMVLALVLPLPTLVRGILALVAIPVLTWGIFTPLALPFVTSLSTIEHGGTPWDLLPLPRGAVLRATWLHHLAVGLLFSGLFMGGVALALFVLPLPHVHPTWIPILLIPLAAILRMVWDTRSNPMAETFVLLVPLAVIAFAWGPLVENPGVGRPVGAMVASGIACGILWGAGHLWMLRCQRTWGHR